MASIGTQGDYTKFGFETGVSRGDPARDGRRRPAPRRSTSRCRTACSPRTTWSSTSAPRAASDSEYYSYVVSATDGAAAVPQQPDGGRGVQLPRVGGHHAASSRSTARRAPTPRRTPRARRTATRRPFVPPNLITLQNGPFSRNDPWLARERDDRPAATTWTRTRTSTRRTASSRTATCAPTTTAAGVFDYTYDVTQVAERQRRRSARRRSRTCST